MGQIWVLGSFVGRVFLLLGAGEWLSPDTKSWFVLPTCGWGSSGACGTRRRLVTHSGPCGKPRLVRKQEEALFGLSSLGNMVPFSFGYEEASPGYQLDQAT